MDVKSRELVMAKLYLKNKEYKMAEQGFNQYLARNPEDVMALKLLGQVYEQINKFDKAFEMYERCYLAEPDRTGVLLDICRILLTQGNSLDPENIDRRKWLNLAIKAFPSNPIVVNYKAHLATLPPDAVQPVESNPKQTNSNQRESSRPSEDTLLKVLEKLTLIDKRLDKIEDMLAKQPLSKSEPSANHSTPAPQTTPLPVKQQTPSNPQLTSVSNLTSQTITPDPPKFNQSSIPASVTPLSVAAPTFTTPTSAPPPAFPSLFSGTALSSSKITQSPAPAFNALSSTSTPNSTSLASVPAPTFSMPSATPAFSLTSAPLFSATSTTLTSPSSTTATSASVSVPTFSTPTSTPFSFSTNLFSESLKKFNVPNTFSFSSIPTNPNPTPMFNSNPTLAPTTDNNDEAGDNELVQNEELPIENTCNMTPIEYKTGEEDEEVVFTHRAKLFRFRDKEFKERGLGDIKILRHKHTGKARLIMRRDLIGLVCLNCWDCRNVNQVRDNQVKFSGVDASDGAAEPTVFLVKFKLKETADTFVSKLNALFDESNASENSSATSSPRKNNQQSETRRSSEEKPEVELVDPKLDNALVNKARELQLPDLFYHKLKNQEACEGCNGCEND